MRVGERRRERAVLGATREADAHVVVGRRALRACRALEATGETLDPTKLDLFREFVNSLDPEGGDSTSSSS